MRRFLLMVGMMVGMMWVGCGGGPDTHYTTVGAVCASRAKTIGTRAVQCGIVPSQNETFFESEYIGTCCVNAGICGNTSLVTTTGPVTQEAVDVWVDSCNGEIEQEGCSSLSQGALPAVCSAGPAH